MGVVGPTRTSNYTFTQRVRNLGTKHEGGAKGLAFIFDPWGQLVWVLSRTITQMSSNQFDQNSQ